MDKIACCMNRSESEVIEHINQRSGPCRVIIGLDYDDIGWHMRIAVEEATDMRRGLIGSDVKKSFKDWGK